MTVTEQIDQKHLEDLERLKNFRLMDDEFFTKCFEGDLPGIQLVLRIVMSMPALVVLDVHTQVFVENLINRSVRLDILDNDSEGRQFNIEIQRADKGAGRKRARYNSSMMDAGLLEKGTDFDDLPETYVIFITERDVLGQGKAVYQIERCILGTGELFCDGAHILYVNGAYRGDDPIGKLMHDFSCTDPNKMNYNVLADRVRFFKESKEGSLIMCKAIEDMRNEAFQEGVGIGREEGIGIGREEGIGIGREDVARNLLSDGSLSMEKIAQYAHLSLDDVKKLKSEMTM